MAHGLPCMQVAIAAQASAASPIVATGHARIAAADDLTTPGAQVSRRHLSFTLNDGFDLGGITFNDEGDEGNEGDEGGSSGYVCTPSLCRALDVASSANVVLVLAFTCLLWCGAEHRTTANFLLD